MTIGVAILAAGKGARVGTPKALLRFQGDSLLARVVRLSRASRLAPLAVITAARADDVEALLTPSSDLFFSRNDSPERGQLSSLRIALSLLSRPGITHALSWPVDHALVTEETLRQLLAVAERDPAAIVVPRFEGRGGHPTLFPRELFAELSSLPDEEGARGLLHRYPERVRRVELNDRAVVRDIDTEDDAQEALVHRVEAFDGTDGRRLARLEALFDACESSCFCRYFHFPGDKNDWLARTALEPDENRRELREAAVRVSDEASGVVALRGDDVIGWMKVAPASALHKLYDQRFYRGLSVLKERREGVFAAGCALVHPLHRMRGVAQALAGGAVLLAKRRGARALEAFPRVSTDTLRPEERWTGPASAYLSAGLRPTFQDPPYPVLRIDF